MARPDVLARARRDLASGQRDVAIHRLRGYLSTDPDNLEVRRVLAALYRRSGNFAEAGRWGFLTADVSPAELIAFERANPSPYLRLRALHYSGDPRRLPPAARDRLRVLTVQADRIGPPGGWNEPARPVGPARRGNAVPCLFVVIALLVLAALATMAIYQFVIWFMRL